MLWKSEKALKSTQMETEIVKNNVADFLNKYSVKNKRVLIAFSGGNDSMCLLSVILELQKEFNLTTIAIHLNHNWRGNESLKEAENCHNFCQKHNIEFYTETLSNKIKCTETDARNARYEFFYRCAKKFKTDIVFTAHNADDNAETLLYRIVKGTGTKGLSGILPVRDIFYRPLLTTYRKDIEKYIKNHHLKPNQDSSNNNDKYKRNFLRLNIIPQLETINKDFKKVLNNLSQIAQNENEIINEYIKKLDEPYKTKNFTGYSDALQKHLIYNLLIENNLDYDYKTVQKLNRFIKENSKLKNGKTTSLADKMFLFVSASEIRVIKECTEESVFEKIEKEGVYKTGKYIFTIKKYTKKTDKFPSDSENTALADLSKTGINFTLRTRTDGDIIHPLGCKGTQKLKKYLNSKKIPKDKRETMPFLYINDEVIWAASVGISEKIKVTNKPTHILRLERENG